MERPLGFGLQLKGLFKSLIDTSDACFHCVVVILYYNKVLNNEGTLHIKKPLWFSGTHFFLLFV